MVGADRVAAGRRRDAGAMWARGELRRRMEACTRVWGDLADVTGPARPDSARLNGYRERKGDERGGGEGGGHAVDSGSS